MVIQTEMSVEVEMEISLCYRAYQVGQDAKRRVEGSAKISLASALACDLKSINR